MKRRIGVCLFFFALIFVLSVIKVEAADKKFSKALSHYIQAGIFERLDDLDKAIEEYTSALKYDNNSAHLHLRLAVVLLKDNQLAPAVQELGLAVKHHGSPADSSVQNPPLIEAHTLLALVYSLQGKLDEATVEYEIALRGALAIEPGNMRIHKSLAQVYFQQNKLEDAAKTCQFILSIEPDDAKVHFFLGTVYEEQGKRYEAIKEFEAAVELDAEFPDALNSLGYLYAEESINLERAEELIKAALNFNPDNGAYIDSLGWVYFKQGRYEETIQQLERAVLLLSDPVIYEHLGDAYLKRNSLKKARESWQKALELSLKKNSRVKKKLEKHKPRSTQDSAPQDKTGLGSNLSKEQGN